jgi:hypothetical protein
MAAEPKKIANKRKGRRDPSKFSFRPVTFFKFQNKHLLGIFLSSILIEIDSARKKAISFWTLGREPTFKPFGHRDFLDHLTCLIHRTLVLPHSWFYIPPEPEVS